jgi:hypothetical protein
MAVVTMLFMATVSTALGLERNLFSHQICTKAKEHFFDHMVWPNAKNLIANFSR